VAAGTSRTVLLFTFAREPLLQRPDPESHQARSQGSGCRRYVRVWEWRGQWGQLL